MSSSGEIPATVGAPARLSLATLLAATAILVSTLVFALLLIHYKLFWGDELLEYYSDAKPSIGAIFFGQRYHPFSLDPPGFHILLYLMRKLLPAAAPEFSSRILSALFLLVTEVCVFRITLRLTGEHRPALFAMALPFLLAPFSYGAEARVYSLLTMLFAVALVSYQAAIEPNARSRTIPLLGLFLSLAAAILGNYYSIFLPLPLLAAEAVRSLQRRRLDWPLLAISASFLVFAFNLPFMGALHEIQAHFYRNGETNWRAIPFEYVWLLLPVKSYFIEYRLLYIGGALAVLLFFLALLWIRRTYAGPDRSPMFLAVAGGALLPVIEIAVAHSITHAYSPRYCLPAAVPISLGLALLWAPWFRRRGLFVATMAMLMAVSFLNGYGYAHTFSLARTKSLDDRSVNADLRAALAGVADQHIYMQAAAEFLTTYYYAGPELQSRMVAVESKEKELYWLHREPSSFYMQNIGITTAVPVVTLGCLQRQPGPHIFIVYRDPVEEWIDREIDSGGMTAEPLGKALSGTIYRVDFPASKAADGVGESVDDCVRQLKQSAP